MIWIAATLQRVVQTDFEFHLPHPLIETFDIGCAGNYYDSAYQPFVKQQLVLDSSNTIYKYKVLNLLQDFKLGIARLFPEILELLQDTLNRDDVIHLTATLLDKGMLILPQG
ncbi:MAG: hypothetical protein IPH20_07625 [Bacteroidales bacterium]|nr:hypothetical protein [Bacteroidales bacterium]